MARYGQKDSPGFGSRKSHVAFKALGPAIAAEQTIEVVGEQVLSRDGCRGRTGRSRQAGHGLNSRKGDQAGDKRRKRPYDQTVHPVAKLDVIGCTGRRSTQSSREIRAEAV